MIADASDPSAVDDAVARLEAGEVVVIPTDTVYGVAVALTAGSVDRLFAAKERPRDVQVPVLVGSPEDVADLVDGDVPLAARRLMDRWWPGALTIVLPRRGDLAVSLDLGGDATTIGLRCPDHRLARELCRRAGPLATTSANRHGQPTPASAEGVAEALGDAVALVLDGGLCVGAPSTVVAVTDDALTVLREGRIPVADLRLT